MSNYTALSIFIADNGEDSLALKVDNLDYDAGTVGLVTKGVDEIEHNIGYYNIEDLINALNLIKNSNIYYKKSES